MKLTYRPEIDGLRAIAVVAVTLYHAQITILGHQPFKGGFIGVDIFFVISGYLITSIILKELVTTGSFSFKHFYERRIRRILPALLFVMLVSLSFAWMYLLPSSFIDFSKSILYSLGFSSNFYFHYSGQEYGAENGSLKPFLHTWSLSVEEQFYILFPIVLLITFKYFRKYLIHILILGFILSLGLADWGSRNHPSFNFYVLPTRGWELLAGSILAYFEITKGKRSENKTLNLVLPSIGLLLIGYFVLFFNDKMFHPSFYTLSPIIGVCLIIWFSNKNELITKLLSTKLFVGIGLISYSLYLWHYPIFAFNLIRQKYFSLYQISNEYLILIVFVFSIISYYYIEIPFRKKKIKFKRISYLIISTLLFLIVINLLILFNNGFLKRYDSVVTKELIKLSTVQDSLFNAKGYRCFGNQEGCNFNESFENEVIIIGDSLVNTIALELKNKLEEKNYQTSFYYLGDCHYFPEFNRFTVEKKIKDEKCNTEYFRRIKQRIDKKDNQIIIFFNRYTLAFTNKRFDNKEGGLEQKDLNWEHFYSTDSSKNDLIESFKKNIKEISEKNKIILLYPLPEIGWNIKEEILKKQLNDDLLTLNDYSTSYELFQKRNKITFDIFNDLKNKNIYRVYLHKLFCNNLVANRCIVYNDKDLLFIDTVHPSKKGAEMINDLIIKEIEKIELKSN
jgi:peptidoglycan/LPS O-acetylase OafA/YrhL